MSDHIVHLLDAKTGISVVAGLTTELCREGEVRHFAGRMAAIALAKTLTGAALLSAGLKDEERQSVQINFNGPLRGVFAEVDCEGRIRGYPVVSELPDLDNGPTGYVSALGNQANITVIRWRDGQVPYTGSISVDNPTIRNDFNEYLSRSEQLFAELELAAHFQRGEITYAAGLMARLMPGGDVDAFEKVRERFRKGEVFEWLSDEEDAQTIAQKLWPQATFEEKLRRPIRFECGCDAKRVRGMLAALGSKEIKDILKKEGAAEITCRFCNTNYMLDSDDLKAVLDELDKGDDKKQIE